MGEVPLYTQCMNPDLQPLTYDASPTPKPETRAVRPHLETLNRTPIPLNPGTKQGSNRHLNPTLQTPNSYPYTHEP